MWLFWPFSFILWLFWFIDLVYFLRELAPCFIDSLHCFLFPSLSGPQGVPVLSTGTTLSRWHQLQPETQGVMEQMSCASLTHQTAGVTGSPEPVACWWSHHFTRPCGMLESPFPQTLQLNWRLMRTCPCPECKTISLFRAIWFTFG